ncbi:hypothetical protein D6J61_25845 [Salmonella enterica subsp. enterica serovar Alachua]|nr:hypothetical protein [Salmonella enterica subsp. enterica serovar Alachua]
MIVNNDQTEIGNLQNQVVHLQHELDGAIEAMKRLRYRNVLLEKRIELYESGHIKPEWIRNSGGQNISPVQIDNAVAELQRVYLSKSWRLTAPLRALNRLFKLGR